MQRRVKIIMEINISDAVKNYKLLKSIVGISSSGEVKIFMGNNDMKLMGTDADLNKIKDELVKNSIEFNDTCDFKKE